MGQPHHWDGGAGGREGREQWHPPVGSDSPQASREGHPGELPKRERVPVFQASQAHSGLQGGPEIGGIAPLVWAPSQHHPSPALHYIWPGLLG